MEYTELLNRIPRMESGEEIISTPNLNLIQITEIRKLAYSIGDFKVSKRLDGRVCVYKIPKDGDRYGIQTIKKAIFDAAFDRTVTINGTPQTIRQAVLYFREKGYEISYTKNEIFKHSDKTDFGLMQYAIKKNNKAEALRLLAIINKKALEKINSPEDENFKRLVGLLNV